MTTAGEKFAAKNARMTFDKSGRVSAHATMSSESRSRPPVPDLLRVFGWAERFELLDCIGSGAMGQVWRAREIRSRGHKPVADEVSASVPDHRLAAAATMGRIVALKMLDPSRVGDEQTLARLDIEAATLMKLREAGSHANVVPILDFKLTESHACLVMEFIPGLNLKKWCEAHRLGLMERVRLIAQVARASGWFHALGIVHRDLKPANILVNAVTHQPVIVDFSIAKLDDSLPITLTNEALGTAPYMAPEQIDRMRGEISPATDVYALGATLYELLTQVHPHPGDLTQVVRRHAEEVRPAPPSALNPEVPRDLECIVLKALSHRPTDRYANGAALAEDLERFLAGQPVQARPISRLTHLARQARRKPALTTALAACVALGVFALWNFRRQTAQRERFALQTQLTTAMQHGTWSIENLDKSEAALADLTRFSPALAGAVRQRLHDDIVRDMEIRLQQNHLLDEDFAWLRSTADWLRPRLPDQAARLESLITERLGRWETQAELRSPFADLHGLFPRSHVHVVEGLLRVRHEYLSSNPPGIVVTDAVSVPMEINTVFVAEGGSFHHLALGFAHANALIEARLYKACHTAGTIRKSVSSGSLDPQSYILYFTLNGEFHHGIHIPDARLLDQPFRLTLWVEREWAEVTLNHQWHLRLDSPFALGSSQPDNFCRISWPSDISLKELTLRTRRSNTSTPLEQADLLAAQGRWAAARRLYEDLRGDPQFGSEADCKIGQCWWREGEHVAALAQWEKVIRRPTSPWRDRCLLMLSMQSLLSRDWEATFRYLDMLPDHLPPSTLQLVDFHLFKDFSKVLSNTGLGIAQPRIDPVEVRLVAKTFQVLQTPPLELANRLGMAHHFARQDEEAERLYQKGLSARDQFSKDPGSVLAATNCLDQWCRLIPSEKERRLSDTLDRWRGAINGQAVWHMEQARRAAREQNLRAAITSVRKAREITPDKLDNRLHTSLWLLEGMLYRMQGAEDRAQSAWRKAQEIAATVTMRHPLHLFDCILLHSLIRNWDLETAGDVLTTLASRHLNPNERPAAQLAFDRAFLTDPAWLTTFNAVLQDERGRQLATDYALCLDPPRELVQRYHHLLFEHYFLVAAPARAWGVGVAAPARAWQSLASPEQTSRVRGIVNQLVTEMATNPRGEIAHLYAYLRSWNDPAAAQILFDQTYPYSPALIENMKWLLQQRHHR
ncbi:MAG TPA: hypothetical protein DDZ88_25390 [Verrucomicrobiales bacterium]|nr:hypothetical protein [Verrucomicrobiales bacterium]